MHLIVIATSPDHNCTDFITRITETQCTFEIMPFTEWNTLPNPPQPTGFVYLKVTPELMIKRVDSSVCITEAHNTATLYENYFCNKSLMPSSLHTVPLLILNGNIHVRDDFSQFYTHLFSIKKFIEQIETALRTQQGLPCIKKKRKCGC